MCMWRCQRISAKVQTSGEPKSSVQSSVFQVYSAAMMLMTCSTDPQTLYENIWETSLGQE